MPKFKFSGTPGPWKIGKEGRHLFFWPDTEKEMNRQEARGQPTDVVVMRAGGDMPTELDQANIRLASQAPEMLAFLLKLHSGGALLGTTSQKRLEAILHAATVDPSTEDAGDLALRLALQTKIT